MIYQSWIDRTTLNS